MSGWRAGLVAIVVGGAILLTGWLVSREPATNPTPQQTTAGTTVPDIDESVVLACVPALEKACSDAAGSLGVAVAAWESGDPVPDRGVVLAPALDFEADVQPSAPIAESPVVIAGWRTRWQPLELGCDDVVDPACVVSSLGSSWADLGGSASWGDFKVGLADATTSEPGLLAWSVLQPALGATPNGLAGPLRIVKDTDAALMEELVLFASRADLVFTTEVAVFGQFQNAIDRQAGRIEIGYLESGPWVEYVAVGAGRGSDALIERLGSEDIGRTFTTAGLRPVAGIVGSLPEGLGEPGAKSAAPDAATRATLISAWEDIT